MSASMTAGQRQMLFDCEALLIYLLLPRMMNHQFVVNAKAKLPVFKGGKYCRLSSAYIMMAKAICLLLLTQLVVLAWTLALASAGSKSAARMAMTAITTSNSISVNP